MISSVLVATAAIAAPGGEKGKPEAKATPVQSHGAQGNSGASYGPKPKPAPAPKPQSQPQGGGESKAKAPRPASGPPEQAKSGKGGSSTKSASGPRELRDAGTGDNPQGRGPAGRTQYCHATHSESNPHVLIETSDNALPAHRAHQDEEDIIPAGSGDCPGGSERGQSDASNGGQQNAKAGGPDGKATYCHSTRSETNPFVVITTSVNALVAHVRHHAGDDIVPPETGDCPDEETAPQQVAARGVDETLARSDGEGPDGEGPQGNPPAGPDGDDRSADSEQAPADSDDGDSPGAERVGAQRRPGERPADGNVLGESESNGAGDGGGAPAVAEETAGPAADSDEDGGDSLPFTGLGLVAMLAVALVAIAGGMTVRRFAGRDDA